MTEVKIYFDRSPYCFLVGPLNAWKRGDEVTCKGVRCRIEAKHADGMYSAVPIPVLEGTPDEQEAAKRQMAENLMGRAA